MHRSWKLAFGLLVGAGVLQAAGPAPDDKTGVQVGEQAPEFQLQDQAGQEQALSALRKNGPVALVFYRSASW